MRKLQDWLEHAKSNGDLHVSIPVPVLEKIIEHMAIGMKESLDALGKAIDEFER